MGADGSWITEHCGYRLSTQKRLKWRVSVNSERHLKIIRADKLHLHPTLHFWGGIVPCSPGFTPVRAILMKYWWQNRKCVTSRLYLAPSFGVNSLECDKGVSFEKTTVLTLLCRHQCLVTSSVVLERPFVKPFAQFYRTVVCLFRLFVLPCPVCDVGVLWPNGWTDQDATWCGGILYASAQATLC